MDGSSLDTEFAGVYCIKLIQKKNRNKDARKSDFSIEICIHENQK